VSLRWPIFAALCCAGLDSEYETYPMTHRFVPSAENAGDLRFETYTLAVAMYLLTDLDKSAVVPVGC